jgi:tRNA (cmo5U34)-methyltransferase
MDRSADTNAAIWKSDEIVRSWAAAAPERENRRAHHWQLLARILPFADDAAFTFLDLGAGSGSCAGVLLSCYPSARAILADFSPQLMAEGERELAGFAGRFHYVEFDMLEGNWPDAIPSDLDAVVTSLCIHHMPDDRKRGLFAEIYARLRPGGWYLNYDPVVASDPAVAAAWLATADRDDPEAKTRREHRSEHEQARWENHVRYMIPLEPQLDWLRAAGFAGTDVYWKYLETVIYGGFRPA